MLRLRDPTPPPFATPAYPATLVFFLVLVVLALTLLASADPVQAALGVGVVALGVPAYFLLFRRGGRGAV